MFEKQPVSKNSQPPYQLYRDPALPFSFDDHLQMLAHNMEFAERRLAADPDVPGHSAVYNAAEQTLRSYAEHQGYAIAGPPPEMPPTDIE